MIGCALRMQDFRDHSLRQEWTQLHRFGSIIGAAQTERTRSLADADER